MKKNIIKLLIVLTAFFIGVSINNSCGDSKERESIWSNETLVDGLYIDRAGYVASKIKKVYDQDGNVTEHIYDNEGRHQSMISKRPGYTSSYTYEYSGKIVTVTYRTVYDPIIHPNSENQTTKTTYEYY